jgi:hypothetical protein
MQKIIKLWDKLFMKQWNIAIGRYNMDDFIKYGFKNTEFKWYPVCKVNEFHADPFLLKNPNGQYHILFEKLCKYKGYGEIHIKTLNEKFEILSSKILLEFSNHLSYPSIFIDENITYIIPESSEDGNLYAYEFDFKNVSLKNKTVLINNKPLLDTTFLKYDGKYWLFSTQRGSDSNSKLLIHYSDSITGPYKPHKLNPFKNNPYGCRPAGNFIKHNNFYYRPTQNCTFYYGSSIVINKLIRLNEDEFEEEFSFEIKPEKICNKIKGIHTINFNEDLVVIDGLFKIFTPFNQFKIYLNKYFKRVFI